MDKVESIEIVARGVDVGDVVGKSGGSSGAKVGLFDGLSDWELEGETLGV